MSSLEVPPKDAPPRLLQRPSNRPAPSLFVGPPLHNASTADLHEKIPQASRRAPLSRHQSSSRVDGVQPMVSGIGQDKSRATQRHEHTRDRTDAVWMEMQNTLEEVELNAASGANVFSREHSQALEELRKAQIELAQAWSRNEGEDEPLQGAEGEERDLGDSKKGGESILASERTAKLDRKQEGRRPSAEAEKSQLEQETENDIMLARQRRQANDRYFERVNKGVVDVVQKLHVVAKKMREVEELSQDVWSEKDSID